MIEVHNLTKSYRVNRHAITALSNINLSIPKGKIFGIIGHSGAGKSTLVRCFNLLEQPDSGSVIIDGTDLTQLSAKELMLERRHIGMIFQHFNLLSSQTIYNNIAFPLRLQKQPADKIKKRVLELLKLVDLLDHADKYPAQLSGGQKQRVGIARALANNPKVLLCDEATSALDPQTTQSILELLVKINTEFNLTIVMITHEMEVIRSICHDVAIIHDSHIVEQGAVEQVFLHPTHHVTKDFIVDKSHQKSLEKHLQTVKEKDYSLYQITYTGDETFKPHLSNIIKQSDVEFSIFSGSISYIRDLPYGQLIVGLRGSDAIKRDALTLLKEQNISVIQLEI